MSNTEAGEAVSNRTSERLFFPLTTIVMLVVVLLARPDAAEELMSMVPSLPLPLQQLTRTQLLLLSMGCAVLLSAVGFAVWWVLRQMHTAAAARQELLRVQREERRVLLQLFIALGGGRWTNKTHWPRAAVTTSRLAPAAEPAAATAGAGKNVSTAAAAETTTTAAGAATIGADAVAAAADAVLAQLERQLPVDVSQWRGVKVDARTGRVNKLILPENDLTGAAVPTTAAATTTSTARAMSARMRAVQLCVLFRLINNCYNNDNNNYNTSQDSSPSASGSCAN